MGLQVVENPGTSSSRPSAINRQTVRGVIFDYKYPDLTLVAYNHFLKFRHYTPFLLRSTASTTPTRNIPTGQSFIPEMMTDLLDAMEASKTMLQASIGLGE